MWRTAKWILIAFAAAVPVALLVTPATRWAALAALRAASADKPPDSYAPYTESPDEGFEDREVQNTVNPDDGFEDRAVQVAGLVFDTEDRAGDGRYSLAKRHPSDPVLLALYVNRAATFARPPNPIPTSSERENLDARREEMRWTRLRHAFDWTRIAEVCDLGVAAERDNAFFSLMGAAALDALGRHDEAMRRLSIAGAARRCDDHMREATTLARRVMQREFGYVGFFGLGQMTEFSSGWIGFLLPLAKRVGLSSDRQAKAAFVHAILVASRNLEEPGTLSQLPRLVSSLADPNPPTLGAGSRRERALAQVSSLARQIDSGAKDLGPQLRSIYAVGDYWDQHRVRDYPTVPDWEGLPDAFGQEMGIVLSSGAAALFVLMAALTIVLWLLRGAAEGSPPGETLPYLLGAAVALCPLFQYHIPERQVVTGISLSGFYALAAAFATWKKAAIWPTAVACVAPLGLLPWLLAQGSDDSTGFAVAPMIVVPVALGLSLWRRRGRAWEFRLVPQLAVLAFGFFAFLLSTFPGDPSLRGARFLILSAMVVLPVLLIQRRDLSKASAQMLRCAIWPLALAAAGWAGLVIWRVASDGQGREQWLAFENSAPKARAWAKLNPEGLLSDLRHQDELRRRQWAPTRTRSLPMQ